MFHVSIAPLLKWAALAIQELVDSGLADGDSYLLSGVMVVLFLPSI